MVTSTVDQTAPVPVAVPLPAGRVVTEPAGRAAAEPAGPVGRVVAAPARRLRSVVEVVEQEPPARVGHKVDYLSVLEHISRLGTKHFSGSTDPIEADEWRSRLVRNFQSTRCPEDYKRDIAVHFLEGDAHNWWLALDKRTAGAVTRFADFEVEFNRKYFPAEAWDRLEAKFLDLVQGRRSVREYEEEFNKLRRYVGKELEDESVQVRRFQRGLRVELRTHCSVRTFSSVSELVERMAMLECNLAEEAKSKTRNQPVTNNKGNEKKRKWDQMDEGRSSSGPSDCGKCGRRHVGECWKSMGACLKCGGKDHWARDCGKSGSGQGQRTGGDPRTCYQCGQSGHVQRDCPKMRTEHGRGRGEAGKAAQARGQPSAPRVYELSKDTTDAEPFKAITGMYLL